MIITRPYEAEDNEMNLYMRSFMESFAKRHDLVINEMEIYGASVVIHTECGRELIVSKADGCRARHQNQREFIYLKETVDGKQKRIPKKEW